MSVLKNKIISSDKDLIGIVFFGTVSISKCMKHSETKKNKLSQTVLKNSKKKYIRYSPRSESFTLL